MKLIITENQFKRLVENIISKNETDIFNDKHAITLLNFLMEYDNEEFGLSDMKLMGISDNGMRKYSVGNRRTYRIGINDGSLKWDRYSFDPRTYWQYNNAFIRRTN